jgi:hypothetical protein
VIEKGLGRSTSLDRLGNRIGLPLVFVARAPDPTLEMHARALLHDMSRFVCGELNIGLVTESNSVSRGVGQ